MARITRRLMSGEEVSQREIDFQRGFYYGIEWILEHPEKAEENLERAARHAWLLVQLEVETTTEGDSPYG